MADESDLLPPPAAPEATWVLVANLDEAADPGKLVPGSKVYVHSTLPGRVRVLGRHRGSRRWVTVEFGPGDLCRWRVKEVDKPGLATRLADGEVAGDEEVARLLCERLARPAPTDDAGTSPAPG